MKKQTILDLIRYHAEGNEPGFRTTAYAVADEFNRSGDVELAQFIMMQLAGENVFEAQDMASPTFSDSFVRLDFSKEPLPLPDVIMKDLMGIVNAVGKHRSVNKFLLAGAPGTGKTESVKQVARLLGRELYRIDFEKVVDCKLGQTAKNITAVFEELKAVSTPDRYLFLIDEIDAIAMDRTNPRDLREMGRVTSVFLRMLDDLAPQIILFATTNLYDHFDKALVRRFDAVVDFNRYTRDDLLEVADKLLAHHLAAFKRRSAKKGLFRKILSLMEPLPYPGDLKNLVKTSLVFSDETEEGDYLKRLYQSVCRGDTLSVEDLKSKGFTVREIEFLTGVSKSKVSKDTKETA